MRTFTSQTKKQLEKSLRSIEKNVEKHQEWIENPRIKFVDKWDSMTQKHRDNAIHHWYQDIQRARELKSLAEEVLKSK